MTETIVVVALNDAAPGTERLRLALEERGHRAVVTAVDEDGVLSGQIDPTVVVVEASSVLGPRRAEVVQICARANATVIAAHDRSADAGQLWRTAVLGWVPWVPAKRGPLPIGAPVAAIDAAAAAVEALRLDLSDQTDAAYQVLARVQDPVAIASAGDALIDTGAHALARFRSRARYAVSMDVLTSHLIDRLGHIDGQHFGWWSASMGHMAFHHAGVALVRSAPARADELLGAFHAAGTLLRFTSRRQWRRADELLDELLTTPSLLP